MSGNLRRTALIDCVTWPAARNTQMYYPLSMPFGSTACGHVAPPGHLDRMTAHYRRDVLENDAAELLCLLDYHLYLVGP